jgi:hypothetical protein
MLESPLTGGCLCGGVRYDVTEPLVVASYCHCTRCQRRTGTSSSANARTVPGSVRIVAGEELVRTWEPPDGAPKAFCTVCGSALWSLSPDDPELLSIRLGTLDDDPGIRPSYRQFVDYAAPWEPVPDDGLQRYPERIPPDA